MNMSAQSQTNFPLTAIRQKESEMALRLLAAQNEAAQAIAQARQKAQTMLIQAAHDGQQAGAAERQALLTAVEQEAQAILAQAQTEADRWQEEEEDRVETAVTQLISIVCGCDTLTARLKEFEGADGHHTKAQKPSGLEVLP